MAYRTNPFLERMSESTTSDQDFVSLFSPKILERLSTDAFDGGLHVFRSPPGCGKTTLLRSFTPSALRAFWQVRRSAEFSESCHRLSDLGAMDAHGPQVLGVFLSCASGYADLPPGAQYGHDGLFRALLDCRIVLRTLRNLVVFSGAHSIDQLAGIAIEYDDCASDLKSIPLLSSAIELAHWAERHERDVYEKLDSISVQPDSGMPSHLRFEGVLWLQSIKFKKNDSPIAPLRLLMIDDLHKLRRKQRELLISELTELRPSIPIWLAERNIALGKELLSQGARLGRDINVISLDQLWNSNRGAHQFSAYAQNILDRRLKKQHTVPSTSFTVHLRSEIQGSSHLEEICSGIDRFKEVTAQFKTNPQYGEWFSLAEEHLDDTSIESLKELFTLRILIARNEEKRQLSLEFTPLPSEELASRDSSQLQGAAEIFMHEEQGLPYYFGIDRLCVMSTTNVEELLSLSAALYDGILNKIVLRKPEHSLLAQEQDRILTDFARAKHDNIPKSHTQGTRAQTLLDSIGTFCRERTFKPSAPIAPGVTGIRLTRSEMNKLYEAKGSSVELTGTLHEVLAECVAENLLTIRASAESTGREEGTVFYLNRTLCAAYGLPIQYGGWQAITVRNLVSWMDKKYIPPSTKYGKLDF